MNFFKKKIGPVNLHWYLAAILLLVVGIIVGSFVDLPLSKAIASDSNFFGKFIESFGELIGAGVAPIAGAIITRKLITKESKVWQKIVGIVIALITIIIPAVFAASDFSCQPGYSWQFSIIYGYIGTITLFIGLYVGTFFLVDKDKSMKELLTLGLTMLIAMMLGVALVNLVFKGLVYRARYRAMAWDNELNNTTAIGFEYYTPWYNFSFWKKPQWFLDSNLPTDFIKSWPSGHTATATMALVIPFGVATFKKSNDKVVLITFVAALVYTLLVAFGRIVKGAHFLSDVCSGALISVLCILLVSVVVNAISNKIKTKEA